MGYNSPKEVAFEFCKSGISKANTPLLKFILLAFLGGTFIAFGGLLTVMVAGGMPGVMETNPGLVKFVAGALFPVGLVMVTVAGADLFTSDCTGLVLPTLQKDIKVSALLKVWLFSYVFNFVGAQFVAYFMATETGLVTSAPYSDYLHNMAYGKTGLSFYKVFIKAIGANWLVCLGTWMGYAGKDVAGKALGIWIPVMLFVTLGYEHSIANMFFIPAAIYSGADITWGTFVVNNLVPATLGNIVGGSGFVGMAYWYIYMKK
ncbi:formate/nitrite transporter family protein [Dysgonomonas sp. 216]|uniref:formate/nitrite transporter family protein n=1 Tax=Dysgonomonas sp. 216 TaxID=2302934 RepID=UPI0013D6B9EB|nr:formate/nitrite transporter family protein [Dysgonomonas sp. 216]NDW19477.1 formate/nitrite transporter family protein [Dysgonomonas sp. 216]